uniref:Uncharacterized protein n=1 Tax=Picea sitchensis TaxID=3332 RepID=D5AE94_PICSI|nr:unknown [Picea sitchensis]
MLMLYSFYFYICLMFGYTPDFCIGDFVLFGCLWTSFSYVV